MKFALDVDGVLADFTSAYSNVVNKIAPGTIPPGYQPSDWNWKDVLSPELQDEAWKIIKDTPNFWLKLRALEGLEVMFDYDWSGPFSPEHFFVTSRCLTKGLQPAIQTRIWLRIKSQQNIDYPHHSVIAVPNPSRKAAVYRALDITHSLDDYGPTVKDLQGLFNHKAFLLDQPWNREKEYQGLPRVFSVKEYLEIVEKESK